MGKTSCYMSMHTAEYKGISARKDRTSSNPPYSSVLDIAYQEGHDIISSYFSFIYNSEPSPSDISESLLRKKINLDLSIRDA